MKIEIEVTEKLVATITQDNDIESPDDWDDTNVFLVANHTREFTVEREGFNVQWISQHIEAEDELKKWEGISADEIDESHIEALRDDIIQDYNNYHIFPLYAYIHSGVSLSVSRGYPYNCYWDSGQVGYVLVSITEALDNDLALQRAKDLCETWNTWLSGDIWHINLDKHLVTADDYVVKEEHIDSCGGYYGYKYAKEELEQWIQDEIKKGFTGRVIKKYD